MYRVTVAQLIAIRDHMSRRLYGMNFVDLGPRERAGVRQARDGVVNRMADGAMTWPEYLGPEDPEYRAERARYMEGQRRILEEGVRNLGLVREPEPAPAPPPAPDRVFDNSHPEAVFNLNTWDEIRPIGRNLGNEAAAGVGIDPAPAIRRVVTRFQPVTPRKKVELSGQSKVPEVWLPRDIPPAERRKGWRVSLPIVSFPYDHCVGVEIEVEDVRGDLDNGQYLSEVWQTTHDGSLRGGSAYEFISNYGSKAADIVTYLPVLDKYLSRRNFSFRCGVHVHVDCTDHTLEDLFKVFLIYTVVEPLIFAVSGKRTDNKFCVAVQDSFNSCASALHYGQREEWRSFADAISRGTKYMAMNILPLRRYNTIEFRHHEGTCDVEVLGRWMLLLLDLCVHCKGLQTKEIVSDILKMNTDSQYILFLRKCFPHSERLLTSVPEYDKMMYRGVAFIKECFAHDPQEAGHPEPEEEF
jgi:hypothetical protein